MFNFNSNAVASADWKTVAIVAGSVLAVAGISAVAGGVCLLTLDENAKENREKFDHFLSEHKTEVCVGIAAIAAVSMTNAIVNGATKVGIEKAHDSVYWEAQKAMQDRRLTSEEKMHADELQFQKESAQERNQFWKEAPKQVIDYKVKKMDDINRYNYRSTMLHEALTIVKPVIYGITVITTTAIQSKAMNATRITLKDFLHKNDDSETTSSTDSDH